MTNNYLFLILLILKKYNFRFSRFMGGRNFHLFVESKYLIKSHPGLLLYPKGHVLMSNVGRNMFSVDEEISANYATWRIENKLLYPYYYKTPAISFSDHRLSNFYQKNGNFIGLGPADSFRHLYFAEKQFYNLLGYLTCLGYSSLPIKIFNSNDLTSYVLAFNKLIFNYCFVSLKSTESASNYFEDYFSPASKPNLLVFLSPADFKKSGYSYQNRPTLLAGPLLVLELGNSAFFDYPLAMSGSAVSEQYWVLSLVMRSYLRGRQKRIFELKQNFFEKYLTYLILKNTL